jgi:hypothetical protein
MATNGIPDYTALNCTNLIIKLKIQLSRIQSGESIECLVLRVQHDSVAEPFSKAGYRVLSEKTDHNRFHLKIIK